MPHLHRSFSAKEPGCPLDRTRVIRIFQTGELPYLNTLPYTMFRVEYTLLFENSGFLAKNDLQLGARQAEGL